METLELIKLIVACVGSWVLVKITFDLYLKS
jgi:hypothetical protein